ncbi:MAG: ABC transporter ATP-binding protein [Coriobacteriia bacterium]|nr:ABC transporter ATP-binding protein [Coriobacteriia bacterium]
MSADTREIVIRTEGLSKHFGDVHAVEDLALTVHRGEIYAFLGRNGAGKTTTIRLMLALIKPTAGSVEILGHRMAPNATRAFERIGSMVESAGAYGNLTVRENLEMQRKLLGLKRGSWVDEAVELCGLGEYLDRRVDSLSLGNKQRVGLGRALLHKPEVLILDEPTNGLDPVGIADVRELLLHLASERKTTVFLSSHILSEVQQLADTIGIIHEGRLLEEIGYEELRTRNREYLELRVSDTKRAAWALEETCGVRDYAVHEGGVVRVYTGFDRSEQYTTALVHAGVGIISAHMSEENLEDHFVKLTGGNGNGDGAMAAPATANGDER